MLLGTKFNCLLPQTASHGNSSTHLDACGRVGDDLSEHQIGAERKPKRFFRLSVPDELLASVFHKLPLLWWDVRDITTVSRVCRERFQKEKSPSERQL